MSFSKSKSKSRSVSPQNGNKNQLQDSTDSLDNNFSSTKLRQSAEQKHRVELINVKNRFVTLLQKLQHSQTREVSLNEIKKLITKNNESEHLRIYLSVLKALKSVGNNSTTKQHEVLVLSIITSIYKKNLVDPIDKYPNLLKTCFKVVEILLNFFNDTSNSVQQACARVILDVDCQCLSQQNYDAQQKLSILWTPLISIIRNGVDKASQSTAAVCINELLKYWTQQNMTEYLDSVSSDVFHIIMKLNSEYHDIFMALLLVLEYKGVALFENKLPNFISKILGVINGTKDVPNSLNAYMCRVNVCKILQKIASLLNAQEKEKLQDLDVIGALERVARHKIIQVQTAATRAIKAWKGEPISSQSRGSGFDVSAQPSNFRSLEDVRRQKKRSRSSSREDKIKLENELNYMKEDLEKMVKGGWGANHRAKNFVKRGTGVGGGHYGEVEFSSTPPKNQSKSHKEHIEELREIIKRGTKENRNVDRFGQLPEDYSANGKNRGSNQKQVNNPTESRKKNTAKYQQDARLQEEVQDFALVEDSGDQMVAVPTRSNSRANPRANLGRVEKTPNTPVQSLKPTRQELEEANNIQISTQEAQELLDHEDSIMNDQQSVKESTQKNSTYSKVTRPQAAQESSEHVGTIQGIERENFKKKGFEQVQDFQGHHESSNSKQPEGRERNINITKASDSKPEKAIDEAPREPKKVNTKKLSKISELAPMISQEELEELMMENNLSEVSDNMSGLLNASDFNMENADQSISKSQYPNSPTNHHQMSIKNNSERLEDSLNLTESKVASRVRNGGGFDGGRGGADQHFTLNPNNNHSGEAQNASFRFQSIHENRDEVHIQEQDEQIQEELVDSYFEESRPKEETMLPLKSGAKPNPNGPRNNVKSNFARQEEQASLQQSHNYQQLIANPPVHQPRHFDKKSDLAKSKLSEPGVGSSQFRQQSIMAENQEHGEQEPEDLSVTDSWIKILSLVEQGEIDEAFTQTLQLDDPIYLLRLLIITKTPLGDLTTENCTKLWAKFLDIYQHNFIQILLVQLFSEAHELQSIKSSLTIQEMNDLLQSLYQISGSTKGKLSFNSALLYNNIDQSLKPKKSL